MARIQRRTQGHTVYSMSSMEVFVPEELRSAVAQLVEDGLAPSVSGAIREILEAATQLKKEDIVGNFHSKALELKARNPGMTYREACVELGKRSGAKAHAEAERKRKAEQKAQKYQADLRKRAGEKDDDTTETGEDA